MEYKILALCLFLCCAVLSSAQSGGGSGYDVLPLPTDDEDITKGLDCESARMVYGLSGPGRGAGYIFDKMRNAQRFSVCRQPKTCCSESAEMDMLDMSVAATREKVLDVWRAKTTGCDSRDFKDALMAFINETKSSLVLLLQSTFSRFFTHEELFDEFYNYLNEAIMTGNACRIGYKFNKLFFEIFLAVLEADPNVDTSQFPNNNDFNLCLYDYYVETSSENIHKWFVGFTRSFNRTLYYLRGLNTAEKLLDTIANTEFTPQCKQALLRSTFCAQCTGFESDIKPCRGLCVNTMRGCLMDYADIYQPFKKFTSAAIRMKEYLEHRANVFTQIDQLTNKVFEAITNIQSRGRSIHEEILVKCLGDRKRRETEKAPVSEDLSLYPRSLFPRATVRPPSAAFNNSAYCLLNVTSVFMTAPESICRDTSEVPNSHLCWNGENIGLYGREVLEFNRTIQEDNPALIVCHYLPRFLRVQLVHLERVTQEMNIISKSGTCPEDDEDCSVDNMRCDYTAHSPVTVRIEVPDAMFDMDDMDDDGSSVSGSGSGDYDISGDGEEVDACLMETLPSPSSSPTLVPSLSTSSSTTEPVDMSTAGLPPSSFAPLPTITPTPTVEIQTPEPPEMPASSAICVPSLLALLVSLLPLVLVHQGGL